MIAMAHRRMIERHDRRTRNDLRPTRMGGTTSRSTTAIHSRPSPTDRGRPRRRRGDARRRLRPRRRLPKVVLDRWRGEGWGGIPSSRGGGLRRPWKEAKGGGGKGTHPLFVRGTSGTTTRDECDDGYRDDGNNTSDRDEKETERIEEVRRKLVERWHAYSDPDAPIEHRRFQIRTSTRGGGGGGGLTAQSLSNADPAVDIAPLLSSVLFVLR